MSESGKPITQPGDGIRSLRSTGLFRAVNFELYAKPNIAIMTFGIVALAGCTAYIAYMRHQFEANGYYSTIKEDGSESFIKKQSRWD